jgi:choice-of-anchor A domain-containing protein
MALVHPPVASDDRAPGRGLAAAAATFNPGTGSQGFGVFVQGNATLGATSASGPVAMGGNLTVGSNFSVASQTAGTFTGTPSPGAVVRYTITATNSGQTAYTGAALTDSLSGL